MKLQNYISRETSSVKTFLSRGHLWYDYVDLSSRPQVNVRASLASSTPLVKRQLDSLQTEGIPHGGFNYI